MPNEELTQKKEALSEKELDGVSGGILHVTASKPVLGAPVIECPYCGIPTVPVPEGGYQCLKCGWPQKQGNRHTHINLYPSITD